MIIPVAPLLNSVSLCFIAATPDPYPSQVCTASWHYSPSKNKHTCSSAILAQKTSISLQLMISLVCKALLAVLKRPQWLQISTKQLSQLQVSLSLPLFICSFGGVSPLKRLKQRLDVFCNATFWANQKSRIKLEYHLGFLFCTA